MEQSTERKAHGVKVFLGTFKSSRDAIAGIVYPSSSKMGTLVQMQLHPIPPK
jgi:hypothetical protein